MFRYDAITIEGQSPTSVGGDYISDFSEGTILNARIEFSWGTNFSQNGAAELNCGYPSGNPIISIYQDIYPIINPPTPDLGNIMFHPVSEYTGLLNCTEGLYLDKTSDLFNVSYSITYLPNNPNGIKMIEFITYYDFMFVAGIIIFLLSFVPLGLLFSLLRKRKTQY